MESLKLRNLGRLSGFIQDPEANLLEMQLLYQSMAGEMLKIRDFLDKIVEVRAHDQALHSRSQTLYSLQLSMAMILNTLLRSFVSENLLALIEQSGRLVDEIISLAADASQYRPLGASGIPLSLVCAWAGAYDLTKRPRLEELMREYESDFKIARWTEVAVWMERKLQSGIVNRCSSELSALGADLEIQRETGAKCCVM